MQPVIKILLLASMLIGGTSSHLDAMTNDPSPVAPLQTGIEQAAAKGWTVITVELLPNTVHSWHSQPQGEFLYVLEGTGHLKADGKRALTLDPGSVATLTSVPHHVLKNSSRTKILRILVVFLDGKGEPHPLLAARLRPGLQGGGTASSMEGAKTRVEQKSPDIGLVF